MVSHISCDIPHFSIPFLSFYQDSALISSASNDLQVSTCLQYSLPPHMQKGFTLPYHCECRAPVYLRLWHIFAVYACLDLDIRFNAFSCRFQHIFWNEGVVHFSFFIRYSCRSPYKSFCVSISFQLLVIFIPLMNSAHLSFGHNQQFGFDPYGPCADALTTSHISSATMFKHSHFVGSLSISSACPFTHSYFISTSWHQVSCKY
jgi:hypothetical protein